jgi:hypothetical protein
MLGHARACLCNDVVGLQASSAGKFACLVVAIGKPRTFDMYSGILLCYLPGQLGVRFLVKTFN